MTRAQSVVGMALWLSGCAAAQEPAPVTSSATISMQSSTVAPESVVLGCAEASAAPALLNVRMLGLHAGQEGPRFDGDTMHSGDRLALYVRSDRRTWVHVVHYSEVSGKFEVVTSDDGSPVEVPAAEERRVPALNDLELDGQPGPETLYVLASTCPLHESAPQIDEELQTLVTEQRTPRREVQPAPARPRRARPRFSEVATYSIVRASDAMVGRTAANGFGAFRLRLRHVP